jgi:hypothetical protein
MTSRDLTLDQAYRVMFTFLDVQFERGRSDDLGVLLGGLRPLRDGSPADPALWADWEAAVRKVRGPDDALQPRGLGATDEHWPCVWMSNALARAGQQGLSVIASKSSGGFVLQGRAVAPDEQGPSAASLDASGGLRAIAVASRIPLRFCPHCGMELARAIASRTTDFAALAEAHAWLDF